MRPLLYFVVLWFPILVHAQQCQIAGQVFFADTFDHTITLKTDSGDLVNFSYDGATSFLVAGSGSQRDDNAHRVPSEELNPEQLNNGDRLCVGTSQPRMVTVTLRKEIDAGQKKEFAAWQADSLYGFVSGLDRNARRITLAVSAGDKQSSHSIDVSPSTAYWSFPRNATGLSDAVAGSLDGVAPGDTLYVRGAKDGASQKFVASLIISGGFRSFAATIDTMDTLDEQLHVRLVPSGGRRTVHIDLGELYAIGQAGGATAGDARRLYQISAADLQPGDTVLILGIEEGTDSLRACALIAGFSPFGVLPSDPSQQMRWIFDHIHLCARP